MLRRLLNLSQNQGAFDPPLCMSRKPGEMLLHTANRYSKREPSELPFSYWELPSREDKAPKKGDWRTTISVQSPHTPLSFISVQRESPVFCSPVQCQETLFQSISHLPSLLTLPFPWKSLHPHPARSSVLLWIGGYRSMSALITSQSPPCVSLSMHMIHF